MQIAEKKLVDMPVRSTRKPKRQRISMCPSSRTPRLGRVSRYAQDVQGRKPARSWSRSSRSTGKPFTALNGGPQYKFSEAVSFQVACDSQEEIDYFWGRLTEGGRKAPAAG